MGAANLDPEILAALLEQSRQKDELVLVDVDVDLLSGGCGRWQIFLRGYISCYDISHCHAPSRHSRRISSSRRGQASHSAFSQLQRGQRARGRPRTATTSA